MHLNFLFLLFQIYSGELKEITWEKQGTIQGWMSISIYLCALFGDALLLCCIHNTWLVIMFG